MVKISNNNQKLVMRIRLWANKFVLSWVALKSILNDKQFFGHIFENFVASALYKIAKFNNIELSRFRTQSGNEADFVLENQEGEIIGIEVNSSKNIDKNIYQVC